VDEFRGDFKHFFLNDLIDFVLITPIVDNENDPAVLETPEFRQWFLKGDGNIEKVLK